jgi:simple sugar transport system ATP-binding protein
MVGRDVVLKVNKAAAQVHEEVLQVNGIVARNNRGLPALKNINFCIRRGEIVGVAGVDGNGQNELVEVLGGLRRPTAGSILFGGKEIVHLSPRQRRSLGIAHIPADRLRMGVEGSLSIEENLILHVYNQAPLARSFFMHPSQIEGYARRIVHDSNIAASSTRQVTSSLSGGNIQKLIIGREMIDKPSLLIAAQPTRGVDVGAIEYVHKRLIELRDRGNAILLVSTELDEILSLSDRILVIYEGEFTGAFQGGMVTDQELGLYMIGAKRAETMATTA